MLIRVVVAFAVAAARLGELAWSRQNIRQSGPSVEGNWSRRTYPLVIGLHAVTIVAVALLGQRRASPGWLALLLSVQPLRFWILRTLGRRWNTRGTVGAHLAVETGGPYRYVRHPNYAVVALELAALPLAFGLVRLAATVAIANAVLLAVRIRDEEQLLRRHRDWVVHFEHRKRFIPFVF